MATRKPPSRVNGSARSESGLSQVQMSAVKEKKSDLVEIAKRNDEFRTNYGPWLGAFLYQRSLNAARPRPFWWKGLLGVGSVCLRLGLKYGWTFGVI
jgi:hypothetical protein